MKIDMSLLNETPMWNRQVADFLSEMPVYSRQDHLNAHRRMHIQPGFEIDLCHYGRAIVVIGERTYAQTPDSLFIIPGHVPHQIYRDLSMPYQRTVICFDDRMLRNRLDWGGWNAFELPWATDPSMYRIRLDTALIVQIKSLSNQMCEEIRRKAAGWETMALSHLLGIMVLLKRWVEQQRSEQSAACEIPHYVESCCEYIASHLHDDLALPAVAKLFSVSPEQLIRAFKREKGMTFHQYVLLQRVWAGKKWLLEHPEIPVTEIALMLGFSSSSQFSRTFRSFTGCTPTEYREHNKQKSPNSASLSELAAIPDDEGNSCMMALTKAHKR